MNHAITVELEFFLISILWGLILMLVYDALRILRRLIKHDEFFLAVEDLIYWVAASLFIFAMLFKVNNGIIRGFSIMGMAIGMLLYHTLLSDMIVNSVTRFIKLLLRPISLAVKKIKQFIMFVSIRIKKIAKNLYARLKKVINSFKIKRDKWIQASKAKKDKKKAEKLKKIELKKRTRELKQKKEANM